MKYDEVLDAIARCQPVQIVGADVGVIGGMRAFIGVPLRPVWFTKGGLVRVALFYGAIGDEAPSAVPCRSLERCAA
jgi:hypothetical protein